jgi:hypothetical protein
MANAKTINKIFSMIERLSPEDCQKILDYGEKLEKGFVVEDEEKMQIVSSLVNSWNNSEIEAREAIDRIKDTIENKTFKIKK